MLRFFQPWRQALRNKSSQRAKPYRQLTVDALEERCLLAAGFVQTNLVSDIAGMARLTDSHLRNPWGVAFAPSAVAFWISDAAAGVSTLYTGDVGGTPIATNSLVVTIPPAAGQPQGKPSGEVFNNTSDFVITSGGPSAPATFI